MQVMFLKQYKKRLDVYWSCLNEFKKKTNRMKNLLSQLFIVFFFSKLKKEKKNCHTFVPFGGELMRYENHHENAKIKQPKNIISCLSTSSLAVGQTEHSIAYHFLLMSGNIL